LPTLDDEDAADAARRRNSNGRSSSDSGNGNGASPSSAARPPAAPTALKTLRIGCQDKLGLLAVVCGVISAHGHNISSVAGSPLTGGGGGGGGGGNGASSADEGPYVLTFVVSGPDGAPAAEMIAAIRAVDGVESVGVEAVAVGPGSAAPSPASSTGDA
jgi:hypothetical protein